MMSRMTPALLIAATVVAVSTPPALAASRQELERNAANALQSLYANKNGRAVGYYNSFAASYGLQAGVQVFGYALFFMNDAALSYLDKSDGWELGVGPSIVVVDAGVGKSLTSTTITQDVYAFIFDQKGLMAGLGIQGSKITKTSK